MVQPMKPFLVRWLVTTFAVAIAAQLVSGIHADTFSLIAASMLLGLVNAFIRPVLLLLTLPLILVTLGFFILVVNALMLWIVGSGIIAGFRVDGFWSAFFGSIIISIVSWLLSAFFRSSDGRIQILTHHTDIKTVKGRVID